MKQQNSIQLIISLSGNIMHLISPIILTIALMTVSGCAERIKPPPEPDWRHTIDLDAKRPQVNQAVFRE